MEKIYKRSFEDTITNDDIICDDIKSSTVDQNATNNIDIDDYTSLNDDNDLRFSEEEFEEEEDIDNEDLTDNMEITDDTPKRKPQVTTLDDINDKVEDEHLTNEERIKQIMDKNINMPPCSLDKKKDEKLKNIMTIATIPFILTSIGLSLFNIGKVRYSLSFLFLSLGLAVMSIFYGIRYFTIKKCTCPVCETQARTTLQFSILWGVLSIGLLIGYIVLAIIK